MENFIKDRQSIDYRGMTVKNCYLRTPGKSIMNSPCSAVSFSFAFSFDSVNCCSPILTIILVSQCQLCNISQSSYYTSLKRPVK